MLTYMGCVFSVQFVATFIAAFVQVGIKEWIFANVPDICEPDQESHLTCPHNQVFLTASTIWCALSLPHSVFNGVY